MLLPELADTESIAGIDEFIARLVDTTDCGMRRNIQHMLIMHRDDLAKERDGLAEAAAVASKHMVLVTKGFQVRLYFFLSFLSSFVSFFLSSFRSFVLSFFLASN